MANPFFSARIPPDLFQTIEQHIAKTGESKTQVLIKALAAYVNHPIKMEEVSINTGVSLDLFSALEQRVAALEQLLQASKEFVINVENIHSQAQPEQATSSNSSDKSLIEATDKTDNTDNFDILPDLWLDELFPITETKPNNSGKTQINNGIKSDKNTLLFAPAALDNSNQSDNTDNIAKKFEPQEPQQVKLFDTPEESIGPYSESKMADELGTDRNKLRRHSDRVEKGKISRDTSIEVKKENQLYNLSYLGKPQGRKLWIATLVKPKAVDNC
jgi:hypothetical protein